MRRTKQKTLPHAPTDLIKPILSDICEEGTKAGKLFGKVEGVLDNYAEYRGTTPGRLLIRDVFSNDGRLHKRLDEYINSIPRLTKQTEERHRKYKYEIRTNIRALFFSIYSSASKNDRKQVSLAAALINVIPPAMMPIVPHLPRLRGQGRRIDGELDLPREFTEGGVIAVKAFMHVWNSQQIKTLEELLIDHSKSIAIRINETSERKQNDSANQAVFTVRKKLGLKLPEHPKPLSKKLWPAKLRGEWHIFERMALDGVGITPKLELSATQLEFSIVTLSKDTIALYHRCIAFALSIIPHNDNLGILDLIRVVPASITPDGGKAPANHNSLIDIIRLHEQALDCPVNGVGFDTSRFLHFTCAVKAIAARNGYGSHIKEFNAAYKICNNKKAKKERKAAKKAGMPMSWIDGEIQILYERFVKIIRSGSFKRKPERTSEADLDINLVLFFVILVTLRYMGYRQQSLVNCNIGTNIIFRRDGSIILHFDKTKNNKRLHMELNETRADSHGLLLSVLSLYYERVYPYLKKQSNNTLKGQFFVTSSRERGSFRTFTDHIDFDSCFYRNRDRFLDVDSLDRDMRKKFHPHFLRGVCADWMITVWHMTFDEAAEVLGDDPATLKAAYVDKDRIYDAGPKFDAANLRLRAARGLSISQDENQNAIKKRENSYEKALRDKDREIASLRKSQEADAVERAGMQAQIVMLSESLVAERERSEGRHRELLNAVNARSTV